MPNTTDSFNGKKYKAGQIVPRAQVRDFAVGYLNSRNPSDKDAELIRAYREQDYSRLDEVAFEKEMLKNRTLLSMAAFDEKMRAEFGDTWESGADFAESMRRVLALEDGRERFTRVLDENRMDSFFRMGLSSIAKMMEQAKDPADREAYREYLRADAGLVTRSVEDTLRPLTDEQKREIRSQSGLQPEETEELLKQNEEQQLAMSKFLLMMQLGGIKQRNAKEAEQYVGTTTMANLIGHGGRLVVTLPTGNAKKQDQMLDSAVGYNRGQDAGTFTRAAATHDIVPKKVNADGVIVRDSKETKPIITSMSYNYGMNFAGGGMGSKINGLGKMTLNDGHSGHCYLKLVPGSEDTCGQMLIGFETSEPGKNNAFGLAHDFHAYSAPQSSYLTDKSAPGSKLNGREVDLSNLSPETFASVMNRFERRYRELQLLEDHEKLASINQLLAGNMINTNELRTFLQQELGFSAESATRIATEARFGIASPDRNLADSDKHKLPDQELALNSALNRLDAKEKIIGDDDGLTPRDPLTARMETLASEAKRSEMDLLLKDLSTAKIGWNSPEYNKLLKAVKSLKDDMDALAAAYEDENFSKQWQEQLAKRIEEKTETVRGLAAGYVQSHGKGKAHPTFSTKAGTKRFYSSQRIMYLTERMEEDLAKVKESERIEAENAAKEAPAREDRDINPKKGAVRDINMQDMEMNLGVTAETKNHSRTDPQPGSVVEAKNRLL
ncbi:MAG: hypothetical protein K6G16_10625 [Lachnospiraceae bacterium]|nr:hypothetical protein [Lachnospiraceae bacterium]